MCILSRNQLCAATLIIFGEGVKYHAEWYQHFATNRWGISHQAKGGWVTKTIFFMGFQGGFLIFSSQFFKLKIIFKMHLISFKITLQDILATFSFLL